MTTQQDPPFSPLVADIIGAMVGQTADITGSLIDSLTERLADSQAETDAIRARITALFDGDYLPSADAVLRALYPNEAQRALCRRDLEASR